MKTFNFTKLIGLIILVMVSALMLVTASFATSSSSTRQTDCDSQIKKILIYDLDERRTYATIEDKGEYTIDLADAPDNFNIEVVTSGDVGSVKAIFEGEQNSTDIENGDPYRFPGDNSAWDAEVGSYKFAAEAYSEDNAEGELCDRDIFYIDVKPAQSSVCTMCDDGAEELTIELFSREDDADKDERIRVRADGLDGDILFDSGNSGLDVGDSFTIDVDPDQEFVITVTGDNHPEETVKAEFTADCSLYVGKSKGGEYIRFKVTDIVFDEDPNMCEVDPTAVPPTAVPPTAVPPTAVPPTAVPPTAVPLPVLGD